VAVDQLRLAQRRHVPRELRLGDLRHGIEPLDALAAMGRRREEHQPDWVAHHAKQLRALRPRALGRLIAHGFFAATAR
jgi:hypothetical protein